MSSRIATLTVLSCLAFAGCRTPPAPEFKIPAEELSRKNPTDTTPEAVAEGQRLYHASDCAMCHGKLGDGKGVLAKDISLSLHNWRDPEALKTFTDGELYYILAKGKGRMPGYERRQPSEQSWEMLDYIRSLSTKKSADNSKDGKT